MFFILSNTQKEQSTRAVKRTLEQVTSPIYPLVLKDLDILNYAIAIKNLETGETFYHNENKKFEAASLYKIWAMGTAFELISEGRLSEDEELVGDRLLLDIALEKASPSATPSPEKSEEEKKKELEERQVKYKVIDAIESMITISDNYAALLISSRSGSANIASFLKEYELKGSNYGRPPETTAFDLSLILEKIYKGDVVDKEYSQRMIDILKSQRLNDRIPKYLPDSVEVAHKTGELGGSKHDAGIVFTEGGDYIIVVLSETKDPSIASEKIAKFSKSIFDYFNKE